jgi:hypothetical protein
MTKTRSPWPSRHHETQRTAATTRRKKDTSNVLRARAERGESSAARDATKRRHPSARPVPRRYCSDATRTQDTTPTSLARLDTVIAVIDAERSAARANSMRRQELTQPWAVFIRRMRLLTSQSWGSRVQNYLAAFYGWSSVDQREERGDVITDRGEHAEVKVTMVTASNTKVNFVQLRPYQNIDGYRLFVVDRDYSIHRFDLTAQQMTAEIDAIGDVAHGSRSRRDGKADCEYVIRFDWRVDNAARKRWEQHYLIPAASDVTPDLMPTQQYENAAAIRARLGLSGHQAH